MHKVWSFIITVFISTQAFSQERIGLSSDPSSGVYSIFLNPAFSSRFNMDWHVNALSFHQFIETDYAYLSNSNLFTALGEFDDLNIVTERNQVSDANSSRQLIFDPDGGRKSLSVNTSVLWPSAIWKRSNTEKVGFFIHTRGMASGFRIPEELGYYELEEVRDTTVTIPDFNLAGSTWTDLGVHYSRILNQDDYGSEAIGVNARLVLPHESGKFSSENSVDYSRFQDTFSAVGLVTDGGYNFFPSGSTGYSPRINGIGLAVDIGYHHSTPDYSYGISLLDFGFSYTSRNADNYSIVSDTTVVFDGSLVEDPNDIIGIIEEVDRQLEDQVSRVVEEDGSFILGMPTAISLQYVRPIGDHFMVSTQLVQRMPMFSQGLRRPNSISSVLHYRSGHLSIACPVTLYEYKNLRTGFRLMYRYFYIGTDHITSMIGSHKFSGTDLYLGFQIYPFSQVSGEKGIRCFDFK
jgi:hypothetical protein